MRGALVQLLGRSGSVWNNLPLLLLGHGWQSRRPEDGLLFHPTTHNTHLCRPGEAPLTESSNSTFGVLRPAHINNLPTLRLTTDLPHFLQGNSPSGPAVALLPAEGPVLRALTS